MNNKRKLPDKSVRFLRVIDQIKIDNNQSSKNIASLLDTYASVISELKAGKTSVRDEWIETLVKEYNVNKEYITDGLGSIYINPKNSGPTYREMITEIELLRQMVDELKRDKVFLQSVIDSYSKGY